MTYNDAAILSEVEMEESEGRLDLSEELEVTLSTAQERAFALDGAC